MKVASIKEKSAVLQQEQVWLVHRSRIFPKNGCIIAGAFPRFTITIGQKEDEKK